ncbi:MAG: hypothetical protein IJY31_08675 [Muribaculaceae bacterium]|nr:hypothetical protein [Muribaculaceae bacterium]
MRAAFIILLTSLLPLLCHSQSSISYDYISSSTLKDDDGNSYGKGDIQIISGRFNMPLSLKMNEKRQPTMWTATLSAKYGMLNNSGSTDYLNPDEIINTSINITHIRPINDRWGLIISLGAGVYAMPDYIRWESILANGGFSFIYNMNKNFRLGVGGGLTNSFGTPILLPMIYINWKTRGKYELNLDFAGRLRASAATWLSTRVKMELTAIEMDGMSAVIKVDGKTKIYSSTMFKSYITPSYHFNKHLSVYLGLGADWRRSANIRNRKLKDMFNFNHSGDRHFTSAFRITAGLRYQLK